MTNKKKVARGSTQNGVKWDSLQADCLKCSRVISPQSLMSKPVDNSVVFGKYLTESESLFSKDYLSFFCPHLSNKDTALKKMCTPEKQHLVNNEVNTSFWKGNSVFACLFVFMKKPEQKEGLRRFFGSFGFIEEILTTGNHFAVIKFSNIITMNRAKKWINYFDYDGGYSSLNIPSSSLWVGSLHPDATEEELRKKFAKYGKLKSIRVFKWKYYAFVNFQSLKSAVNALDCMQGHEIRDAAIELNFATEQQK